MKPVKWFALIVFYTIMTMVFVFLAPSDSVFIYFRYVLGFSFVTFVPGYCLISLLFSEGKLDLAEQLVLSVALSFGIAGISGLFLGLSPINITIDSITISLTSIVLFLAVFAFLRKMGLLRKFDMHRSKSVSS